MAMEEWVENTHAETALSNILPCVDHKTTNQTLIQSKKIVNDIVNVVDQFVYNFANANPPSGSPNYRNQSGPPMPALCYPYNSQLEESRCGDNDVTIDNASTVRFTNFNSVFISAANHLSVFISAITGDLVTNAGVAEVCV